MTSTTKMTSAAAAAAAVLLLTAGQAAAGTVPPEQHPRPDPTAGCELLPDPGSSGDKLYPAGDDTFTSPAGQPVVLDVLANDCANNTPGTEHSWTCTFPVPPAQFTAGDFSAPVGQVSSDDNGLTFTPNPGWSGTVVFTYQWFESGDEEDHAWHGPYTGRGSTTALVTITITAPASTTPAPKPTPSASVIATHTTTHPAPKPAAHHSTPAAPAAVADPPQLAETGAMPRGALGAGAGALGVGAALALAGRRRRQPAATAVGGLVEAGEPA